MTTSNTLRLKKPLDAVQQARLSQVLNPISLKKKYKKESTANINNKNNKKNKRFCAYPLKGKE